jgi:hypothetical protein
VTAVVIADDARPRDSPEHHPMRMNVLAPVVFKLARMLITPIPAPGKGEPSVAGRIMGWLMVLFLMSVPRLILVGMWIFGGLVGKAIDSTAVRVLGFLLLPTTTLTYAIVWSVNSDKVSGAEWILVVIAFFVDIGIWASVKLLSR